MVGLSDIPCVGQVVDIPCVGQVVDRITKAIVDSIFRGLWYVFCYRSLFDQLDSEIEKLNIEQGKMSKKVKEEKDNGKIIHPYVLTWLNHVEEIKNSNEEFSPSCNCIQCLPIPDPVSRFRMGKNAAEKAETVTKLTISGRDYLSGGIAQLPPVENVPRTVSEFQKFQSREDAYKELWEALVNEDSARILGIHGMPGVGKTRMVEHIWKEAKEKNKFDVVVRVDVGSEKNDVIKLQDKIANQLDFPLDSKYNVERRASQLENSLMNRGKSLIILDDVWETINFGSIGIPFGDGSSSHSCKILLTSRHEDVCLQNYCNYLVKITPLTSQEAWILFSNTVGTSKIDSLQDETLAKKVCDKCAGLPLVILVIGKALKFRQHCSWKAALDKLENCEIKSVPGIDDAEVYACLKLSFDNMPEEAKRCLLLCSLLPNNANIHIKKLVQLATGSQLVHGQETSVGAMVDRLKLSSLLLEGKNDEVFKLHDIIRAVARSIAATPEYAFVFAKCGSSLPENYSVYGTGKLLHLELEKNNFHFPHDLMWPDLHTLSLRSIAERINQAHQETKTRSYIEKISGGMFGNLRFLVLVNFSWERQFSLQGLDKLKTLVLERCDISYIGDTDVSFFPESLDSLCIWKCHLPVPLDLPNLKYLRKLEIQQLKDNVIMVPNAISSLSNLEELNMPAGFFTLEDKHLLEAITLLGQIQIPGSNMEDQIVAGLIFDEISKLTRLTSLQISFNDTDVFQDTHIFHNLNEYNICVGFSSGFCHPILHVPTAKLIELHDCRSRGMENLLEKAEKVVLENIDDFKGIIICSSNKEVFADLRTLYIDECNNMECLARISQDEIQHTRQTWTSFSTLTILKITSCSAIKYLFSESVAKCLLQLQVLRIYWCPMMEVIVMNEGTSGEDIINFPKLKSMELSSLRRLTSFYRRKNSGSTSVIDNSAISSVQRRPSYDGMVTFPSLENLIIQWLDHNDTNDILLQIKEASRVQL